jgi:hypothetical protein
MTMKRLSAILLAVILTLGIWFSVQADIAPPQNPPGSNLEPENETTQVRMVAETVVVDVLQADPPKAKFTADFTMLNLGNQTENLAVRFPIAANSVRGEYPEISNIGIRVNGKATDFRRVDGPDIIYQEKDALVPWAEFTVTFPSPDETVDIRVSYDLDGTGYPNEEQTSFYYVMSTGAGWKGTIGSADIILRLPYEASPLNVIIPDEKIGDATFDGREVSWSFTDFEPAREHDFDFNIVKPSVWNRVVIERKNTDQNPKDGEAWGRLGKAYKEACFASAKGYPRYDESAYLLYILSRGAYEDALALLPDDGLWHAGYAELLLSYNELQWKLETFPEDKKLGYQELELAYQLAPNEPIVQELAGIFAKRNSDGTYDFTAPTAVSRVLNPTTVPEEEPDSRGTAPVPGPNATATSEAPPKLSNPICGGTALILPILCMFGLRRKAKS